MYLVLECFEAVGETGGLRGPRSDDCPHDAVFCGQPVTARIAAHVVLEDGIKGCGGFIVEGGCFQGCGMWIIVSRPSFSNGQLRLDERWAILLAVFRIPWTPILSSHPLPLGACESGRIADNTYPWPEGE